MTILLLLKLTAAMVSVGLAAGILARDHELAPNRLIAAFLLCNAWWAGCEWYLYQISDPDVATMILRWMTLGWMPMGLFCMHGSLSLTAMPNHPIGRLTPYFYMGTAFFALISVGTDWVISASEQSSYGTWRPIFGPAFFGAYLLMAAPLVSILTSWRGLMELPGRDGGQRLARVIFFGVSTALIMGTITAVVMPLMGFDAVGITTSLLAAVGLLAAWTLRCYGYTLISPAAFAREIFDTLEDGVVVLSEEGLVLDANRAFSQMLGIEESSVKGRRIEIWIPEFPAEFDEMRAPTFMSMLERSGESLPVVVSPPVALSARGRASGHIFLIRDEREVVSLQRQLAVSGRLAAVGDLSKSISESIREPAIATRQQLERLASDWQTMANSLVAQNRLGEYREAVEEGLELIAECIEGVDRVTSIVNEVGCFSDESEREGFERFHLAEIVESAVRIARPQAKPNVEIETRLDSEVEVTGRRSELERVVTNLLVNAFHALDASTRDAAHLAIAVGAQGSRALLHVEDDGCGIAPSTIERIFDPFFTTKPVGKGTGLGLAISYHIVRKHDGQIRVSSVEGRGTSVSVELPRASYDPDQPDARFRAEF